MYELNGEQYTLEQIQYAAGNLNLTIEEYIEKYGITESVKTSTTDLDASVENDQASDSALSSEDFSLDVPTEDKLFVPFIDNESKLNAEEETKLLLKEENNAAFEVLKDLYPDLYGGNGPTGMGFNNEYVSDQGEFTEIDLNENAKLRLSKGEMEARAYEEQKRQYYAENPEELTTEQSIINSLSNGMNQLAGVDDRAKWLWSYLGVINGQEEYKEMFDESNAEIARLDSMQSSTIGFTDLDEREGVGQVTGGLAATFNAVTSFAASAATSASTLGLGLASDMVSGSIKDYNDTKAKKLGITVNQLIEKGEADTLVPAALGVLSFALEKIGISKVASGINKIGNGAAKTAAAMIWGGINEGGTEWVQHGVDTLNTSLAEGKSLERSSILAGRAMGSKEGLEAFLQGFAGGGTSVGGGRALKASFGLRSTQEANSIDGLLNSINNLENSKFRKNLTDQDIATINASQKELRNKLRKTINDGLSVFSVISNNQIDEVNLQVDILSENSAEINRIKKSDKYTLETKKELIKSLEGKNKEANQKIVDIRNEAEKISNITNVVEGLTKSVDGVTLQKMTPQEVEEFSKNKDLKDSKGKSIDPSLVAQEQGFIYQNPKTGEQEIIINTEVSARDKAVTVAQHEFLHALLYQTVKGNPKVAIKLGNSLEKYINKIDSSQVKDSVFKKRLELYKDDSKSIEREEVLTLFSDALATGDIKFEENVLTSMGDVIRRTMQSLGVAVSFETGEDVYNFIKDYNNSIEKGKLNRAQKTLTKNSASGELTSSTKKSSKSTLFEGIQELVPSTIKTEKEYNKYINSPDGVKLFNSIILPTGAIQRYVRDNQTSQEQGDKTLQNIQDRILKFNPQATRKTDGKVVGIEAFTERVMSDAMFGKMDANKSLAKESERASKEESIDNPDVNTQLADDVDIDSKIDNTPKQQTSKLRRDLGIKQSDDIYDVVKKIAKKIFGKDLPDTKLRAFVNKAAKNEKELIKNIQDLISTEKAIDETFLNKNILNILDNLSLQDLAKLQRGFGKDIFVKKVKKLTKGAEVDKAIKDKKLPQGTSRTSNPILYERSPVTLEQAKEFFQGKEGNESSKRKVGLVGVLVENLTKEAAPEVTKELVEEGKMTPAQRAKVLDDINKDPELKFSKGIKRGLDSVPSSKRQEVVDKFGVFAQGIKNGLSVDAAINQVFGFLNPKQKELLAETLKPELNKIIVNQKDLETGKPKEVDIVKFLTDAVDEINQKEVTKKTLGLGPKSLNFKNKFQLYGYFNLIDQFINSKIKNMDSDFDKAFYIVNTFAPTLTAAAKVSDGSLTWETINNLPTLVNKKTGKDKESLRYSLFANNGQMGEVLIKSFLKNPELLVFKNSQLLYNGKKLFNPRVSQTVSPALTSIKKTGKLSDDLLNKSQAYAEQNTNAVIELATFFKELKDTDAGLSINDFGMFLQGANGDMSAIIRAAAKLDSVAGLNDNLSLDPKKWRFEHNPPARTMQVHLANYIQGNITEDQLRKEFDNYTVSIIPKLMDDVINERYQDTSPLNATSKWQRYYNEYSFGRTPYATTVYKNTKDGKYTTEEVGKFAPAAYKSVQTAEIKNKKELAPVFKFSKSTPVDNQQVLNKMSEVDNENVAQELKFSKAADLSRGMNDIIQNKTGIASEKTYSRVKAEVVGASKGKFDFFIPPSAEDFVGLLYKTLGKGKLGNDQMAWYKAHLLNPFARAMDNISRDRVALMNDFKALKKELNAVPKTLRKKVPGENFTQEQAVRAYIWNKQGMSIPGMSQADLKSLNDFVSNNAELVVFADQLIAMQKGDQYAAPSEGWVVGNIVTDLMEGINTTKRSKYLEVWQQNADQIFSEANLNKLEAAYGKKYRVALENSLRRMKTGKNRSFGGDTLTGRVTDWLTNSIGAIMFFNTRSAVLQTISAINFINFKDNNIFAAGKAFANQPQYWKDFKTLFNSDFLVERRDGLKLNVNEADIAEMAKKDGVRGVISEILRLGFLPTQLADSFAIASGGSTFYRNRIKALEKEGMSKKDAEIKAFQDFRETAEESQQSSRPDRISQQQAGPLGRIILAFANTPAQYARLIKKASSDLKNGRGDAKTNISKILYYGVAQNLMFNALQQALFAIGFGDEEEEEEKEKKYVNVANGMADSLLRGMGLGGAVFSVLKNTALRLNQESDKKSPKYQDVLVKEILQISPPISSKVGKLKAAGRAYSWNKKDMMTMGWSLDNPAYLAAGQVIAATTNIPLDRAFKKIDNIRNASNSDLEAWQRVASAAGWSAWELDIQETKSSSSSSKATRGTSGTRGTIGTRETRGTRN